MGVTTLDLLGIGNTAHPAALGEYGEAPKGYRLPASTRLGAVQLQIGDLARSLRYYQKTLGLYNYAILLPDRASLGRFVQHLADTYTYAGSGDHVVSEALYLADPDGLGIEVYADPPRDKWKRLGRELMIATYPVDVQDLIQSAGGAP